MFKNRVLYIAIIIFSTLNSCYHKELQYSFEPSYGGVLSGNSCYYLGHIREFQKPKGISIIPDGGMSRDVRNLFGLFRTDTLSNSTILLAQLGNVVGWPTRYNTRLDKNDTFIAIGIENITQRDSISGIYFYNLKSGKLNKYSKESALPALSSSGSLMVYCIKNKLVVDDYFSKTTLFSYLLDFVPVFVTWKNDQEINIFFSNPLRVKVLNIATGRISNSNLRYIKNYDQEIDINKINLIFKDSSGKSKAILDKYL